LISIVAIQGMSNNLATNIDASSAFLCLPTAPATWTSIGDWTCGTGANALHVAAAYRITDGSDSPGTGFSWTFSSTSCGSQTAADFIASVTNTVYSSVDHSAPIDVVGSDSCVVNQTGGLPVSTVAVTTNVANDLVVGIFDAANADQSLVLPVSGSDLSSVVGEDNTGFGPANFTAYQNAKKIGVSCQSPPGNNNGECGPAGSYGPFTATQSQTGTSIGVTLALQPGS
jgi:hypothetical protein